MEEFDDLIPQPDADGSCDLAHRGWKVVDSVIWTLGAELLHLDLSFNRIEALPPDVGGLFLLRTLNISCNRVASIPQAILRCKRLRILKANGNALTSIPDEVGWPQKAMLRVRPRYRGSRSWRHRLRRCSLFFLVSPTDCRVPYAGAAVSQRESDLRDSPFHRHPGRPRGACRDLLGWLSTALTIVHATTDSHASEQSAGGAPCGSRLAGGFEGAELHQQSGSAHGA
eukprot:scaffold442_cov268-Pinguiococcus_pyrenoidosus.AAC.39